MYSPHYQPERRPRDRLNWLDRHEIEALLESIGIACYEHETADELRDAVADNMVDGELPEDCLDQFVGRQQP